jgi:alpha-L-fucosidase
VRELARTASKGGNYLLNVGPDADGRFPPQAVERLEAIGAWLAVNGDSIYGTRASLLPKQRWDGVSTLKPCPDGGWKLFLHVFGWPADGTLRVAGIADRPASVRLMGSAAALVIDGGAGLWMIRGLPPAPIHPDVTVVELSFPAQPGFTRTPAEISAAGTCSLTPGDAALSKGNIRLGRAPDDSSQVLRDWRGPDGTATWRIAVATKAAFSVALDISAPGLANDLAGVVLVDGQEAGSFVIPASPRPAKSQIVVRPVTLPAGFPAVAVRLSGSSSDPSVTLYSITLAPVRP